MPVAPSLEAARAALRDGATFLESPPYAACHAGVNYYRHWLERLRSEFPQLSFDFLLCCGDDPAIAHDALRLGFIHIRCTCSPGMLAQLQAIAAPLGAKIVSALDR